jgi:hypothetical protein
LAKDAELAGHVAHLADINLTPEEHRFKDHLRQEFVGARDPLKLLGPILEKEPQGVDVLRPVLAQKTDLELIVLARELVKATHLQHLEKSDLLNELLYRVATAKVDPTVRAQIESGALTRVPEGNPDYEMGLYRGQVDRILNGITESPDNYREGGFSSALENIAKIRNADAAYPGKSEWFANYMKGLGIRMERGEVEQLITRGPDLIAQMVRAVGVAESGGKKGLSLGYSFSYGGDAGDVVMDAEARAAGAEARVIRGRDEQGSANLPAARFAKLATQKVETFVHKVFGGRVKSLHNVTRGLINILKGSEGMRYNHMKAILGADGAGNVIVVGGSSNSNPEETVINQALSVLAAQKGASKPLADALSDGKYEFLGRLLVNPPGPDDVKSSGEEYLVLQHPELGDTMPMPADAKAALAAEVEKGTYPKDGVFLVPNLEWGNMSAVLKGDFARAAGEILAEAARREGVVFGENELVNAMGERTNEGPDVGWFVGHFGTDDNLGMYTLFALMQVTDLWAHMNAPYASDTAGFGEVVEMAKRGVESSFTGPRINNQGMSKAAFRGFENRLNDIPHLDFRENISGHMMHLKLYVFALKSGELFLVVTSHNFDNVSNQDGEQVWVLKPHTDSPVIKTLINYLTYLHMSSVSMKGKDFGTFGDLFDKFMMKREKAL